MSTTNWTSTTDQPMPAAASQPVAEVHVLMQGLGPGQSQVQIRWPDEANSGGANASAIQGKMIATVIKEIQDAAALLGG